MEETHGKNTIDPKNEEYINIMKHCVIELNTENALTKGVLYHRLHGSLQMRLVEYGIPKAHVSELTSILQEVGAVRALVKGGAGTVWEIIDKNFVDACIHKDIVMRALRTLSSRRMVQTECKNKDRIISDLKKEIKKLKSAASNLPPNLKKTLEQMAELIVERDELLAKLALKSEMHDGCLSQMDKLTNMLQELEQRLAHENDFDSKLAGAIKRAREK